MNETNRLTTLVQRLLADEELVERLRTDPVAFQREEQLSDAEIDALLSGDELRLIALGVEPATFHHRTSDRSWLSATLMRVAAPAVAALAALGVAFGPALPTASAARARFGIVVRRRRAGRAIRYQVHPRARRALRRHGVRQGYWLRTNVPVSRFARAKAFGVFTDERSALAALQKVDPNIGQGGEEFPGPQVVEKGNQKK